MSAEYNLYLNGHRSNVATGFYWIRDNLPELIDLYFGNVGDLEHQICFAHDSSKNELDEYEAYDRYFYGGNRSYAVVQDYNRAWLTHLHRNPHHWQWWILVNDDPENGEMILDMPFNYILEMICDWWAFSWSKEKPDEIFDWYDKHKDYMKLSPNTRKTVEDIIGKIRTKLEELAGTDDGKDTNKNESED